MTPAVSLFSSPYKRGQTLLKAIGNTPLLQLETLTQDLPGIEIYGKAEFLNPGGSVKDRAGLNMILQFFFLPAYPFGSIMIFFVDVIVIWGLLMYGGSDRRSLRG